MTTGTFVTGRPVSLAVLDFGLFRVNANGRVIGICGFMIQTEAGERILDDTGFPAKYVEDAARASPEDGLGAFGEVLTLAPDHLSGPQRAWLGLVPADVDLLVMTHTHIDHVGGIADFPRAPIVIAAANGPCRDRCTEAGSSRWTCPTGTIDW